MLNETQERWCSESRWDFSDLKALFINCTLKKSPDPSHTDGLVRIAATIMEKNGVAVERIRALDHQIAIGASSRERANPALRGLRRSHVQAIRVGRSQPRLHPVRAADRGGG